MCAVRLWVVFVEGEWGGNEGATLAEEYASARPAALKYGDVSIEIAFVARFELLERADCAISSCGMEKVEARRHQIESQIGDEQYAWFVPGWCMCFW